MSPRPLVSSAMRGWVERHAGGRVVAARRLTGGITSIVHRLAVDTTSGRTHVVLRQWPGRAAETTDREACALTLLDPTPVPAPKLLATSDGSGTGGVPALLMTRVPGRLDLTPADLTSWLRQLADMLVAIHDLRFELPAYEPTPRPEPSDVPAWVHDRALWRDVLTVLQQPRPQEPLTFAHADYQHFNILWSRGKLSGVVDWTFPAVSSPDHDVGHCRLNLVLLFGLGPADEFRARYEAVAGRRQHPWWDLHRLTSYDPVEWHDVIPRQVAGRRPVDLAGMTGRVEEALRSALSRL